MIFGFFKEPTFEDHSDRLSKLLYKSYDRWCTADEKTAEGHMNLARASVGQAVKILDEAMYVANEAIKLIENNDQKESLTKIVNYAFIKNIMGDYPGNCFSENVREAWDKAVGAWLKQFNEALNS